MVAGLLPVPAAVKLLAQEKAPGTVTEALPGWGFDGVTGPEHWSELSPNYALCQFGIEQSPVDLVDSARVNSAHALLLDYRPVTAHVVPLAWTVQVKFDPGCTMTIHRQQYTLELMTIRHPSEHLLSGRALEMELQFTHWAKNGALAMVGVFVRQGKKNEALERIITEAPVAASKKKSVFPINPLDLLPPSAEKTQPPPAAGVVPRPFYRYMGSLTTPPCTEGVVWTIFKTPIEASAKQIRELSAMFPANARPANRINRRFLLEYGG